MAVLAEGISVVVRFDSIARLMDDDWARFLGVVPNQTLCCDNELAPVSRCWIRAVEGVWRDTRESGCGAFHCPLEAGVLDGELSVDCRSSEHERLEAHGNTRCFDYMRPITTTEIWSGHA